MPKMSEEKQMEKMKNRLIEIMEEIFAIIYSQLGKEKNKDLASLMSINIAIATVTNIILHITDQDEEAHTFAVTKIFSKVIESLALSREFHEIKLKREKMN